MSVMDVQTSPDAAVSTHHLRVLRAIKQMTQTDVASKLGISLTRYWRIENGMAPPTDDEWDGLARILGKEGETLEEVCQGVDHLIIKQ